MSENEFIDGKIVVVTGGGGTLCSAISKGLARMGAKVAVLGRTREKVAGVAAAIAAEGGTALAVTADVTQIEAIRAAREEIESKLGFCSLLINGAGGNQSEAITSRTEFTREEISPNQPSELRGFFNLDPVRFSDVLQINLLGTVIPCQIFGREMAARGEGTIINFASMNSIRPLSRVPAYAMSKAAIVNFTQWLAAYLAPAGIRVNAIAPGFFLNERNSKILLEPNGELTARGKNILAHTPMKRFGQADELLGTVCWLLDKRKSGFVTGVTVGVDGGFLSSSGV